MEMEARTIFLATDGRHRSLGRGDHVDMTSRMASKLQALGTRGWVAILSGDYYGQRPVKLSRVHGVGGPTDELWASAVDAFMAERARLAT